MVSRLILRKSRSNSRSVVAPDNLCFYVRLIVTHRNKQDPIVPFRQVDQTPKLLVDDGWNGEA